MVANSFNLAPLDIVGNETCGLRFIECRVQLTTLAIGHETVLDWFRLVITQEVAWIKWVRDSGSLELAVLVDILHVQDLDMVPRHETLFRFRALDLIELVHLLPQFRIRRKWSRTRNVLRNITYITPSYIDLHLITDEFGRCDLNWNTPWNHINRLHWVGWLTSCDELADLRLCTPDIVAFESTVSLRS